MSGLAANDAARDPSDLASYARRRDFDAPSLLDARVERDCPASIAAVFAQVVASCLAETRADRIPTETLLASLASLRDTARGGHSSALARPPSGASFLARLADAKS